MNKTFKISEEITFESIGNNFYILNVENGKYFKLSISASLIWSEVEKGVCSEDIKLNIKSRFAGSNKIEDDVDETLNNFIKLGFIKEN